MLLRLMAAIPPHEQVWGETEDVAIIVLLGVGVVLTLALIGLFAFILTREGEGK